MENEDKKDKKKINANKIMTNGKIFKGVSVLIIILVGIWFYNYSTLKDECRKQVEYKSTYTYTDGSQYIMEATSMDFYWGETMFESRKAAVKGCMIEIKEVKKQLYVKKECDEYAKKEAFKELLELEFITNEDYSEITELEKIRMRAGLDERYKEFPESDKKLVLSSSEYNKLYSTCLIDKGLKE